MRIIHPGESGNLLPGKGCVRLIPDALAPDDAANAMEDLMAFIPWHAETLTLFGRSHPVPRLVSWHGDAAYTYSGLRHDPLPWTPALTKLKIHAEGLAGAAFNAVLLNLYRNGADGMGWHADDETSLGLRPVIASLSLGATRRFLMRPRTGREPGSTIAVPLTAGSLLVMEGETQTYWQHAIPKTKRPVGPRINLTFRRITP